MSNKESAINQNMAQAKNLESQANSVAANLKELKNKLSEYKEQKEQKLKQLQEQNQKLKQRASELQENKRKMAEIQDQIEQKNQQILDLTRQINATEASIQEVQIAIQTTEKEQQNLNKFLDVLRGQQSEKTNQIDQKQTELLEHKATVAQLNQLFDNKAKEIRSIEDEISDLRQLRRLNKDQKERLKQLRNLLREKLQEKGKLSSQITKFNILIPGTINCIASLAAKEKQIKNLIYLNERNVQGVLNKNKEARVLKIKQQQKRQNQMAQKVILQNQLQGLNDDENEKAQNNKQLIREKIQIEQTKTKMESEKKKIIQQEFILYKNANQMEDELSNYKNKINNLYN